MGRRKDGARRQGQAMADLTGAPDSRSNSPHVAHAIAPAPAVIGRRPCASVEAPAMPGVAALAEVPRSEWGAAPGHAESRVDDEETVKPPGEPAAPAAASRAPRRPTRFILLAVSVALAAGLGAAAGTFALGGIDRLIGQGGARGDTRVLDAIAQLRAEITMINDALTATRASFSEAGAITSAQLARITDAIDRAEHAKVERRAAPPPAQTDVTGSVPAAAPNPKPVAKPAIVAGWAIRKVYDGSALIEGRSGIIEVEPGTDVPGLGVIQDIRRQDGHWVVVTARGLIMPLR